MTMTVRGGLLAAVSILALTIAFTPSLQAQEAATLSANAELAAMGSWSAATTYAIDDIVTSRGSAWRSKRNNNLNKIPGQTQPSSATYWELFARGFNPAGAWSSTPKYQPDDLATHLGQTWRAKRTVAAGSAAPAAGANWELLVSKGADGATGATGPAGPNTGIGDGSTSAPSISFTGDPDTGIYHPAANKIALVEGGTLFLHNLGTNNAALGLGALANGGGLNNTAVGSNALANPSGGANTAVGNLALNANTTAVNNTAVGDNALTLNVGGSNNTAIGASALASNTSGASNIGLGESALFANQTGANNVAIGNQALRNSTTTDNTAVGYLALNAQTTGYNNTALGSSALAANTEGHSNTAIGYQALNLQTTGISNVAVGNRSLASNATAAGNTAVGYAALEATTFGGQNVALGANALKTNTTGTSNTGIGTNALSNNNGGFNIAIGHFAAENLLSSSFSIIIGNSGTGVDSAVIRLGTPGSHLKTFIAGISGVTTDVGGAVPVMVDSAGQLGVTSSSLRYKYDVNAMGDVNAMLQALRPVTFRYKQAQSGGAHPLQYGLIAEEVAATFPDLAVLKDGVPETVKYHLLPSFLLAGYQAQQNTIAAQAVKLEGQAGEIADLKQRLIAIEAMLPKVTKAAALQ